MLKTEHYANDDGFTALAGQWDELVDEAMTATPFQMLAYQRAWWTHLQPAGAALHTLAVRNDDEQLIAIACFYLQDGVLHFNGCVEETDYLDLICRPDDAESAWEAIFEGLTGDAFPAWDALDLCNVPEASPTRTILPQLSESRGFSYETARQEVCPVIFLPESFDDYLAGLDKKQRHETRRKLRRARGAEAEMKVVTAEDDVRAEVDDFLDLLERSMPEKAEWLNAGRRAVFHEVAAAALEKDMLELLFFVVRGEKAAALFNFDYKDRVWVYNSGLAPRSFGHLSPGVVLTAWSIERAIERGYHEFDFLRGDESYKYKFGAEDTKIFRIHIEAQS